jgi:hypothetical protein
MVIVFVRTTLDFVDRQNCVSNYVHSGTNITDFFFHCPFFTGLIYFTV